MTKMEIAIKNRPQSREMFREISIASLFPLLRKGLWHTTSLQGYQGIRQKEFIYPNTGSFRCSYPQTKRSFAFDRGYVALFDFELATDGQCIDHYICWMKFFSANHNPLTVAIELNKELIVDRIISNDAAVGSTKEYVPYVEVWYDGPIPTHAILRYLVIEHIPESLVKPDTSVKTFWLEPNDPSLENLDNSTVRFTNLQ